MYQLHAKEMSGLGNLILTQGDRGGGATPPPEVFRGQRKNGGATRRRVLEYFMGQTLRNFW